MGYENPIRTLGDYSKPSHEGYKNTIELPVGNNVVPLRSDTIQMVQNGCSFNALRSEDPNQYLKDFFKLVDSLDFDGANRERTRLRLIQFSLRDQASNWLERLPVGSIPIWEDLTTRFLAQFFTSGWTAKLRNDILMFQQHQGESLSEAWTHFKDLLQKVPHHGIDLWLQVQIFYDHVNTVTRRTIDQSAGGKLRDRNAEESWALLEDLALYDNESWNEPRDFAKPVKEISLPQDVLSTSDCRLIELENQVQRLMEAHLALMQPTQVKKITSSCKIYSGTHDTQYCMENSNQAFVEYASSPANAWKGKPNFNWAHAQAFTSPWNDSFSTYSSNYQMKLEKELIDFDSHQEKRLSSLRTQLGQQQDDMISKINLLWKTISEKLDDTPIHNTAGSPTAQMNFTSTNYHIDKEIRGKGIKSPSKLFFLKYLSQSSLAELNKNPSSPKRVHFVNSIIILNKEGEAKEEGSVESGATEYRNHEMTIEDEEEVESEEESEEVTKEETK
ncbi:MAK10-like protein [Tanacetum coccineum]